MEEEKEKEKEEEIKNNDFEDGQKKEGDNKNIEKDEFSKSSMTLSLSNEKENMFLYSDKYLNNIYKKINDINSGSYNKRKSMNDVRIKTSIRSFVEQRKNLFKSKNKNKNKNENISSNKECDLSFYEKYQDCENLIFYLRTQLILCFITDRKKNNESFD